jgi:SAM-dependent methyltransferase
MAGNNSSDLYADFAAFYEFYVGGWIEDLPFYLEYAKGLTTPLLEVGAGSGRLTIPFARAGYSVIAVDASASMLDVLKSRLRNESPDVQARVQVIDADMCVLDLGCKYELIIVGFDAFNYLLTPPAQKAALKRLSLHLAPQGLVLLDVFLPLKRIEQCPDEPVQRVDTAEAETGNKVRGWNVYSMDKNQQIETRKLIFEVTTPNGKVSTKEFTLRRRYFYPSELEKLFSENGFSIEDTFRNYNKECQSDSEQLQYVLRRSARK